MAASGFDTNKRSGWFARLPLEDRLLHYCGTRGANGGEFRMTADVQGVLPASLAFVAPGAIDADRNRRPRGVMQRYLRDDKQRRKLRPIFIEQRIAGGVSFEGDGRLKRRSDDLVLTGTVETLQNLLADG